MIPCTREGLTEQEAKRNRLVHMTEKSMDVYEASDMAVSGSSVSLGQEH